MIDSNEIKKKVPKNLQNKVEFGNLLSLIGNNKIKIRLEKFRLSKCFK